MNFCRNEKGEFTIETMLVFSISFMAIVFIFYVGIVMYQHVHLQSIADRIASRGAMMYANRVTDMDTGYKSPDAFWNSDPYRYIFEGGYKNEAQTAIKNKLNQALTNGNVIGGGVSANANVSIGVFTRKVEVTGKRDFRLPFVRIFGLNNSMFDINVKSTAYIMDMPETIRNVDLVCDLLNRIPAVANARNKISELKTNLQNFINKISIN